MAAPSVTNGSAIESKNGTDFPSWLENVSLYKTLNEVFGEYEQIVSFVIEGDPENSSTGLIWLLNVHAEVQFSDQSTKSVDFILKTQKNNPVTVNIIDKLKLLSKEEQVYNNILPKFAELYANAGKDIKFAPKSFKFDSDPGVDYVLLEDLRVRSYRNANQFKGLDLEHLQHALTKLSEFHAASACFVEHYGPFRQEFTIGVFKESNKDLLKEFNASSAFLTQLKKWKNCQQYYEKLANSDDYLINRLLEDQKVNPREFNVLNHGDCWANNIMFQYDAFGKIKNTLFIDFQVSKYGSPANDLYYLILSSAADNIKLSQFDYLVHFYYDQLVANLKFLNYHRPLPKLKNLHNALLNNGLAAYLVVTKVLPLVLFNKSENNKIEYDTQDESKLNAVIYANHKYVKAMADILPWLDNRGLLDWK